MTYGVTTLKKYKLWAITGLFLGIFLLGTPNARALDTGSESGIPQALLYEQEVGKEELRLKDEHRAKVKESFFQLYHKLWERESMDIHLHTALEKAMESTKGEYLFENIRMMGEEFQEDFTNHVVQDFSQEFTPQFSSFFDKVLQGLIPQMEKDLRLFTQELQEIRLEKARYLPGVTKLREFFIPQLEKVLQDREGSTELPLFARGLDDLGFSLTGLITTVVLRKILKTRVRNFLFKRVGKAAGKKVITLAGGPWMVGFFALWTAWDVGSIAWDISTLDATLHKELEKSFSQIYTHQCPEDIWQTMAPGVQEQYELVAVTMKDFDRKVEALSTSRNYTAAVKDLAKEDQERVAGELIILERETGLPLAMLAEYLSFSLVELNESHIYGVAIMLKELSPQKTVAWLECMGDQAFSLWRKAPSSFWQTLPPTEENKNFLVWLGERKKAEKHLLSELPLEECLWIWKNLSPLEQKRLFTKGESPLKMAEEVGRLRRLPKGQRKPYGMASNMIAFWDMVSTLGRALPSWLKILGSTMGALWVFFTLRGWYRRSSRF